MGIVVAPHESDRIELAYALCRESAEHSSDALPVLPATEPETAFGHVVLGYRCVGMLLPELGVQLQCRDCGPSSTHDDQSFCEIHIFVK